jgi:hypothetical protein
MKQEGATDPKEKAVKDAKDDEAPLPEKVRQLDSLAWAQYRWHQ